MNLDDIENDIIDAVSKAVVFTENHKNKDALIEAERAKVLVNELFIEIWHRHHVSGIGPVLPDPSRQHLTNVVEDFERSRWRDGVNWCGDGLSERKRRMEKLCIFCKHLEWLNDRAMGSIWTGEYETSGFSCKLGHFDAYGKGEDRSFNDINDVRGLFLTAENCADYEPPNAKVSGAGTASAGL